MGGGGLYVLVAYGGQNILLSGNPDFTFFYKTYKKYTHFSEESVTQPTDGPQVFNDQPIQVRLKIQRVADLVRDLYLVVDIPDIYCKWIDLNDPSYNRAFQYNFNWTRYIGCQLIQQVGFYIGGQKIQEFDGNYMIAKAQADLTKTQFQKWQKLVGDVPEFNNPAAGIWAGGSASGGYPLVYPDVSGGNVNRPSIFGRQLMIPLPFWFTETTFNALPSSPFNTKSVRFKSPSDPSVPCFKFWTPVAVRWHLDTRRFLLLRMSLRIPPMFNHPIRVIILAGS